MSFDINIVKQGGVYKSCRALRHCVNLDKDKIFHCCTLDLIGGDSNPYSYDLPILSDDSDAVYDKDFFDKAYENKLEFMKKLNEGEPCECSNCAFVKEQYWEPMPSLVFKTMHIGPDYVCNSNCIYCNQDHSSKCKYNFYEFIKAVVDLGYFDINEETNHIGFSGGEPTLMQHFDDIMDKVGFIGGRQFATTCITFNEKVAQYMEVAKTGGIFFSIDSGTPETFKKIKGVDQFDRTIANFKKYYERTKYKNRMALKYIVTEDNCSEEELDAFLKMIEDNGLYGIAVYVNRDFYVPVSDKVRAGMYYLMLRIPLVARCRPFFGTHAPRQLLGINEKLRMEETWWHRLLIHKIEEKGLDIKDIIQHVREL